MILIWPATLMGNVARLSPTFVNQKLTAHRASTQSRAGRVSERTDFLRWCCHRVHPSFLPPDTSLPLRCGSEWS